MRDERRMLLIGIQLIVAAIEQQLREITEALGSPAEVREVSAKPSATTASTSAPIIDSQVISKPDHTNGDPSSKTGRSTSIHK